MSRRPVLAAFAGLALLAVAPALRAPLHAQSSERVGGVVGAVIPQPDSILPTHRLATVTITGEPASRQHRGVLGRLRLREDIRAMERQNRALSRQVSKYDREIVRLESHLTYLKTVVTDSLKRETAVLDSATASIRARRLELEAKLKEMEAKFAVPVLAATPADSTKKTQ